MLVLCFLMLFASCVNSETCKSDHGVVALLLADLTAQEDGEPESLDQIDALEEWFASNNKSGNKFFGKVKAKRRNGTGQQPTFGLREGPLVKFFAGENHRNGYSDNYFMSKMFDELSNTTDPHNVLLLFIFVTYGIPPIDNQSENDVISQIKEKNVYVMTVYIGKNKAQEERLRKYATNASLAFHFEPHSQETGFGQEILDAFCQLPFFSADETVIPEPKKSSFGFWIILVLVGVLMIILVVNGILMMILRKKDTWDVPAKKNDQE